MAMDAAPVLKRKDTDAQELWLDDGGAASGFPVSSRATKIRRLDTEVPPVVPGMCVPPPQTQQQQQPVAGLGAGEVRMFGGQVPVGMAPAPAKRKGEDAPELWLDDGAAASGFPVSSRATKIRRLDAEVPLVVPEFCAPPPQQQQPMAGMGATEVRMCGDEVPVIVAPAPNEERAIVLYKPDDAARNLLLGPLRPEFPLRVSPDWIHGLSTVLREASEHRPLLEELARAESSNLAMVPWVPVPSNSQEESPSTSAAATTRTMEMMDAEDAFMEVEEDGGSGSHLATAAGVAQGGEALPYHQWPPQQHCMAVQQQPLPAASYQPSPVTWSW